MANKNVGRRGNHYTKVQAKALNATNIKALVLFSQDSHCESFCERNNGKTPGKKPFIPGAVRTQVAAVLCELSL